ncbi:MAG: sodium-dependent bicarbonate transport family permease [Polaromonas sp.]|nr:sodium-dependent bicarbonate transport family permease [Polaromonas sp.]
MIDVVILFFLLGLAAGLVRSELKLPPSLYETLSIFLLLTIGIKGGEGLATQALGPLLPQLGAVMLLGVVLTLIAFAILRTVGRFPRADAASIAAHYGSVSVATFAVGANWLLARGISYEPQVAVFLTVMEVPGIMVGIVLARGLGKKTDWKGLAHETFLGKGVFLLMGGMAIGWAALLVWWTQRATGSALLRRLAATGRAAFTNYLGTSIVMTTLFYGYGLGWYGALNRAELYGVVIATWALMLAWSLPWLRRFRYGPVEWLWRSMARLEWQPMRIR